MKDKPNSIPEVFDPSVMGEHGVTIPAATPTGISIPNPFLPNGPQRTDSGQGADSKQDQAPNNDQA